MSIEVKLSKTANAPDKSAGMGGAFEGADRVSRELARWRPPITSADGAVSERDKLMLDGRATDMLRNDGMVQGALYTHQDSIVGAQYRLNAKPSYYVLGLDATWADEFSKEVEAKFRLFAESDACWLDASRKNTFTSLVRLAVCCAFYGGEVLASAEWLRAKGRPFNTAIQMIDADRLSNPNGRSDSRFLNKGIEKGRMGEPLFAHIRSRHPGDRFSDGDTYSWKRVPFYTKWGRVQMIHIMEQKRPAQTRGVSDMAAVLKESRMAKKFHDVSLQNAIVNASYAAAIESELPPLDAYETMGASEGGLPPTSQAALDVLKGVSQFSRGSSNLTIDGVKIPYLYPGTKLKLHPAGQVGNVGQDFENALHRYIASGLNISYEEYSRDYSETNYAASKAAANATRRFMQSRKRAVADRFANMVYALWLEEAISSGEITAMPRNAPNFWDGLNKEAYCKATWIGASMGQVDELKESQAALIRVSGSLSTLEDECAKLGKDYQEVLRQRRKEQKLAEELGVDLSFDVTKKGTLSATREKNE